VRINDAAVLDAELVEPLLPQPQLGTVRALERDVVEPDPRRSFPFHRNRAGPTGAAMRCWW
jgi:hypothetical protein